MRFLDRLFLPCPCLVVLVLTWCQSFYGQIIKFDRLTTRQGLISDEVYNLHQDRQGYLWIFSKYGTTKFDGSNFTTVLKNLPFKESFVYCIHENRQGKKWVANSNGNIYVIQNDSAFVLKGLENMTSELKKEGSEIFQLQADDHLNIYALTKGTSYKIVPIGDHYKAINLNARFKEDSVMYKIVDSLDRPIVLVNRRMVNGLKYINKFNSRFYIEILDTKGSTFFLNEFYKLGLINPSVNFKNLKRYGSDLYFTYSNVLVSLRKRKLMKYTKLKSFVMNFTRHKDGHFWVGCLNDGVYELDSSGSILNHYLEKVTVNDLLIDHQNGLWISTEGTGLYHCADLESKTYVHDSALESPIGFLKILKAKLFVGNTQGDIVVFDKNKRKTIKAADTRVFDIVDHSEGILGTTLGGLISLRDLKAKTSHKETRNKLNFGYYYLRTQNDTLVGATRRIIIYSLGNKAVKGIYCDRRISSIEIFNGKIWIGTDNGIYTTDFGFSTLSKWHDNTLIYDTLKLSRPNFLNVTEGSDIVKIVKDREAGLWFCTKGNGLYYVRGESVLNYEAKTGLPDNIVNDVFIDSNGDLLLSCNSGLFAVKRKDLRERTRRYRKIYSGAVTNALEYNGSLYLGTVEGLVVIRNSSAQPEKLFFNLAKIKIDTVNINPDSFRLLRSKQRSVEFIFDIIDFSGNRPNLKYIITGTLKDSGITVNPVLKFTGLPPGVYTLTAFPDSPSGRKIAKVIRFEVDAPFWRTAQFYILTTAGFLTLTFIVTRMIVRYKRRKEEIKIRSEQLLLEYKLIALKAQVNPHFMSNCLSAIQDLVMSRSNERALFYISEFGLLMRQILEASSKQIIPLQKEIEMLKIYLSLEQLRFEDKFEYDVITDKNVSQKESFVPPLILNPIVENAIWHGLLPVQNKKKSTLLIKIALEGGRLKLMVEDNGVGLAGRKERMSNNAGRSLGIQITEQRLQNINYLSKSSDAEIIFTNLAEKGNISTGTRVTIFLPANLNQLQHEEDHNSNN